jgi:peptidyl-prolyl cis-trans isomerase A (cyclophilin A)
VPIESNNGLSNVKYSLAMARMGDPNSATSQWFINVEDNTPLDYPGPDGSGGYTVFGKVVKGFETSTRSRACWWTTKASSRTSR